MCLGVLTDSALEAWSRNKKTHVLLYSTDVQMAEPINSLIHIVDDLSFMTSKDRTNYSTDFPVTF